MNDTEIILDFQNIKKDVEHIKRQVDVLHSKVGNLESAIISLQNTVYGAKHRQATPAQKEADVLVGLDPEICEKLEVYEKDNTLRVRTKEYLRPKTAWNTVNKYLRQQGFTWVSQGKESYWRRPK